MSIGNIGYKNNDTLGLDVNYIKLMSNIEDEIGVLFEHKILNKGNVLEYSLIENDGNYYFVNAKETIKEIEKYSNGFICPKCRQALLFIAKGVRNAHFRHQKGSADCDYKKDLNSFVDGKLKGGGGEGEIHKCLKLIVAMMINSEGISVNIPVKCYPYLDRKAIEVKVETEFKKVILVKADLEKQVLKKDCETNGYRPDITAFTEDGEEIYIEITDKSGKTVNEYYEIWERLGKTVLEVVVGDNPFNNKMELVKDVLEVKFLYNVVNDKARRKKLMLDIECAELKESDIYIKDRLKHYKKQLEIEEGIKTMKKGKYWGYFSKGGENVFSTWQSVRYLSREMKIKIPYGLWLKFKKDKQISINKAYKNK